MARAQNGWNPFASPYPCTERKVNMNENLYIHFSESTESIRPNVPQHLVELNSEHFANFQNSLISQSYDQNKFSAVLLKENAFF